MSLSHERSPQQAPPATPGTFKRVRAITEPSRKRRRERKQQRLTSARKRRILARWLRRTANHAHGPRPSRSGGELLLHHRVAAVRTDLHEIAALVEHSHEPDPACIASLYNLLANGCDSPLYNSDIHDSELRATLYYARAALLRRD